MEGGPQAFLSWATGVPVVSTRMEHARRLIEHGRNGLLADVEDADGLAGAAAALLMTRPCANAAARRRSGVRAYAWPVIARRYYDTLYRPVLEGTA